MEDFTAPSFSLGFDFDDEEEQPPPLPNPSPNRREEDFDSDETLDPDPEDEEEEEEAEEAEPLPRPVLKRLRRGPPPPDPPPEAEEKIVLDDDIEDLSSQEEHRRPDRSPFLQSRASCGSSNFSLHSCGVVSSQAANKLKSAKITPACNASTSASFEASTSNNSFPRLTVSPLRKIQLLDSDLDDPSSNKGRAQDSKEVDTSKKRTQCTQYATENNRKTFKWHKTREDLWKDFNAKENISLATPAFDEFCEEYFTSAEYQKVGQQKESNRSLNSSRVLDPDNSVNECEGCYQHKSVSEKPVDSWEFPHPQPPAYKYLYHDDARIRRLIRERLPFFVPIAEVNGKENQLGVELDYMSQFGPTKGSGGPMKGPSVPTKGPSQVRGTHKKGLQGSSKTRGKRSCSSVKEASNATESWVNPRCSASLPKDATKRRVSAVGGGSGRWFTSENGRKVYITKDGTELSGRIAYRQYRKDSGAGFRKGRKKAAAKRKRK
ncbi:Uncharacterized protein M6B38_237560 [Iris pallida]|uniref:Uncharacterized protein n=1 Tax=Iris pallida TaxID=29817 RepID=A0AAX6DM70_IRIPA|nr:Uncharacterized protein M6B38_237560 [Iris pallida]